MTSSPRRVLMTADAVGGVWTYALDLIAGLPEMEFLLVIMGPAPAAHQVAALHDFRNLTWVHRPYALEWMEEPWSDVDAAGAWLLELEASFAPDLVHLNGYVHAALAWDAPVIVVAHSCVRTWWRAVKNEGVPSSLAAYCERVRSGLDQAGVVVAPTRTMLEALRDEHGPVRVPKVIYNGRSPDSFLSRHKSRFVFSAGRLWDEAKNLRLLDEIADRLPWPVYAAGSDSEGPSRLAHLKRLDQLSPSRLKTVLAEASIYAAPALYEPFGLVILEAALSECALVLADIPSLQELWEGAACFVSPREPDAWLDALHRLMEDDAERRELGQRARRRGETYHCQRMLDGYRRLYASLARSDTAEMAA